MAGHLPYNYMAFRQRNTGPGTVGQVNVLIVLQDIGPSEVTT